MAKVSKVSLAAAHRADILADLKRDSPVAVARQPVKRSKTPRLGGKIRLGFQALYVCASKGLK